MTNSTGSAPEVLGVTSTGAQTVSCVPALQGGVFPKGGRFLSDFSSVQLCTVRLLSRVHGERTVVTFLLNEALSCIKTLNH